MSVACTAVRLSWPRLVADLLSTVIRRVVPGHGEIGVDDVRIFEASCAGLVISA